MGKIFLYPSELTELSKDELAEELLKPEYNTANLRQIIRMACLEIKDRDRQIAYWKERYERTVCPMCGNQTFSNGEYCTECGYYKINDK